MKTSVVSDTSTLIVISHLQRLDLLANLFDRIILPSRVAVEIAEKENAVSKAIAASDLFKTRTATDENLLAMLDGILDRGEAEALTLAKELDCILLIDEKKGRKIALGMNLKIAGFLGILLLNHRQGKLNANEVRQLLDKAKSLHFRLSAKLERQFLEELDKPGHQLKTGHYGARLNRSS